MNVSHRIFAAALLACALPAVAEIYSYTDEQGNRVFTDRPGGRSVESVKPGPTNRMPAVETHRPQAPEPAPTVDTAKHHYSLLEILAPQPDATIRDNAGGLLVKVASTPGLLPGHRYRLLMDGYAAGLADGGSQFVLQNIDRGTHQLTVEVIDENGQPLQSSLPRTFHMMRTSLAQRRMVNPCKKDDYGVRPECPLKDKPKEKKDIPFVPFL
ncbi:MULTISPECIES: DUF4124 domain-containing protein [Pseudomonadaceae]|uniref:Penicillin-binding protein n=1 Tax=Stutzerimonas stutzeri TaxID=316 RepID=A0A0D9AV55_STUST|nr:DUF4124 domain-containing protein [Stutzerimonas stutzeri]KJH84905.1 penicillin-binding protein [Stutzerimonas stutzeri]